MIPSRHLFTESLYLQYFGKSEFREILSKPSELQQIWLQICIGSDTTG